MQRMHNYASLQAARETMAEFDLASEDDDYEFYTELEADEAFRAVAFLYQQAELSCRGEHATQADRDMRAALKRAVREHAQRVRIEIDA